MSETETRDDDRWVGRDAATNAELSRLRAVVEAVQALADEWWGRSCEATQPPTWREVCRDIRAALAPVSSSGEAESGEADQLRAEFEALRAEAAVREAKEATTPRCPTCGSDGEPLQSSKDDSFCPDEFHATPAPVLSGGQADGEGEAFPGHFVDPTGYHFGFTCKAPEGSRCNTGCAVRCDPWGETGTCDHAEVSPLGYCNIVEWMSENDGDEQAEDGHALLPIAVRWDGDNWRWRILAARPVLSREALRARLDGHWPTFQDDDDLIVSCDCGWTSQPDRSESGFASAQYRDHLADVLAGGEQA